jgi:hypothetical protein
MDIDKIQCTLLQTLSPISVKNYTYDIKKILKDTQLSSLNDLISHYDLILSFLSTKNPKYVITKLASILKFIHFLEHPMKNVCINSYRDFLSEQTKLFLSGKDVIQSERHTTDWDTIVRIFNTIIQDPHESWTTRIACCIYLLFPRRTRDFTDMKINQDDQTNNVLIFTETEKKFIIRQWKNKQRRGEQVLLIEDPVLIELLQTYIDTTHNTFLLQQTHAIKSLSDNSISQMFQRISKKYSITCTINGMRHSVASHVNNKGSQLKEYIDLSNRMGTSINMLDQHYIDTK